MSIFVKPGWIVSVAIVFATLLAIISFAFTHKYVVITDETYIENFRLPDGTIYSGGLKNGVMHGQGTLVWPTGEEYVGGFSNGVFAGQGVLKTNGDEYRGEFAEGDLIQGEFIGADGGRYKGGFLNSEFHGAGEFTNDRGGRYIAEFTNGDLTGPGEYFGPDGEHYQGEFKYWLYDGEGVFTEKDGVYKGEFNHGIFHGDGEYRYAADSKTPDKVLKGKWRWGKYDDPEKKAEEKAREVAIEAAIYKQSHLLDSTAEQLAKSDSEQINMYFLGVAGYSRQDVFRKELEFIQPLFDSRFNTKSRSMILNNSFATMDAVPLATPQSIERSLHAIAKKMDQEKDILFVYLTSHGSTSHHFSIEQQGISLPDLSAERLGGIIKSLPVKWKVIVISACYSGGYIPYLESPNTLVMTAASHDRKSFGCSEMSEMTYFGRAFFQNSLPDAESFEAAFTRSEKLIEEWEKELGDDVVHSLPQISMGKAIKQYLPLWWKQIPPAANNEQSQQ